MGSNDNFQAADRRLDSWKEIAAFFGRDERTVRRWEKENALPVHRVPGGAKGRVHAYEGELRQWLTTPQAVASTTTPESAPPADLVSSPTRPLPRRSAGKWAAGLALCTVLGLAVLSLA
jgi:hypothetical protein